MGGVCVRSVGKLVGREGEVMNQGALCGRGTLLATPARTHVHKHSSVRLSDTRTCLAAAKVDLLH
jgi:hypothetical protein